MNCKVCGTYISKRDMNEDGLIVCPGCGKKYRIKAVSAETTVDRKVRTEDYRSDKAKTAKKMFAKTGATKKSKKGRNKGKLIAIITAALALVAAAVVVVMVVTGGIGSSGIPKNVKVGQTVKFGSFEQDNNTANGAESIKWIVLEKTVDKTTGEETVLLISKEVLDMQHYSDSGSSSWEDSSVRKWLNGTFYEKSFSQNEKDMIVMNDVSSLDGIHAESDFTEDKVYILSYDELEQYRQILSSADCGFTKYALSNRPLVYNEPVFGYTELGYFVRWDGADKDEYWGFTEETAWVGLDDLSLSTAYNERMNGIRPVIRIQTSSKKNGEKSEPSNELDTDSCTAIAEDSLSEYQED